MIRGVPGGRVEEERAGGDPGPLAFVTLALGSNLGDPPAQLARAREALSARGIVTLDLASTVVWSVPMGPAQPDFCNQVVNGTTTLSAMDLLAALQTLERDLGRRPSVRWGPRAIDLDILDYDGRQIDTSDLRVPHPRLAEREFVLLPWNEIAPDYRVPGLQATVSELLAQWRTEASRAGSSGADRVRSDGRREGSVSCSS